MRGGEPSRARRTAAGTLAALAILAGVSGTGAAEDDRLVDGRALWHRSLAAQRLPDMRADISLLTVTAAGDRVQLRLRAVGRLADDRVNRSLMARVVSGGGSLLGTGFLSVEHLKVPDDLWMFLPALGRPKRLVASNLGDSFMGSEFALGDLVQPEPDEYDVTVRGTERIGDEPCWVLEARPRSRTLERDRGLSREVRWLAQRDLLERKIEQYDVRGKLLKTMDVREWTAFEGGARWLARERVIRNVPSGASSTAVFSDVRVGTGLEADLFQAHRLAARDW